MDFLSLADGSVTRGGRLHGCLTYKIVIQAGQIAYAEAYKWVYYVSIAFGAVSVLASLFLGDIGSFQLGLMQITKAGLPKGV
ncbi:hypothetical protein FOQG_13122 [Fusarium oxysporum f. sp. raphani 54005]|uniref:Uncharacterized protein n=1 Tax=Fusarium oxysporum f. sp. raphani 54005 TaxID=1089458 RepID=X0BUE0_FUSOX|nr:hypothetical protein FOQG_13122 [Fusarium oxysporum f. sp. raphani 54005]